MLNPKTLLECLFTVDEETWAHRRLPAGRVHAGRCDAGLVRGHVFTLIGFKETPIFALECLFMVDEETGLTGAFQLDASMLSGAISAQC